MVICNYLRFSRVAFKKIMNIGEVLAEIENVCSSSKEATPTVKDANGTSKDVNETSLKQA